MLAVISVEVGLRESFLGLGNTKVQFTAKRFSLSSYITFEALPTTGQVELIDYYEIVGTTLEKNCETFIIHVIDLEALKLAMSIHLFPAPILAVLQ